MPADSGFRFCFVSVLALALVSPALADVASDMQVVRQRRIAQITKAPHPGEVEEILAKMRADGSFGDLDYNSTLRNDSWGPKFQLERMTTLVGAYLADGPDKANPKIRAAVLKSLDWWLAHDYKNSNWFWNKVGVPNRLSPTLLTFWDELSDAQKAGGITILLRSKMETPLESSGTNLVWFNLIAIDRGLLTNDPAVVKKACDDIANDIHVAPKQADGAQPDNSYLYHGSLIYTLGYGLSYLRDQAHLGAMLAGTSFAMPKDKLELIRDWTLDGAQWMTRGSSGDLAGIGRSVARKDQQDVKTLVGIGQDLLAQGAGRADELREMVDRAASTPNAKPLVGNRQFWRADMMTHQRPGWYASARLYSARTRNTEVGNGEGLRSFYVADGTNLLMRDGLEYYNFTPFWNWQHVPGTTVELLPNFGPVPNKTAGAPDSFNPNLNTIQRHTSETFVGGVSDGMYGVFGGKFSRDAMTIRRGWFFFDDQYVCLGSGLTCGNGDSVVTTLDDRTLKGTVTVADGKGPVQYKDHPADDHAVEDARWLLHDGVGYVFLKPTSIRFHAGPRIGDWNQISTAYPSKPETRDVFDAWIEHGPSPKDAAYAYTVYPNTSESSLAALTVASPVTVASNTADCQAVWNTALNRGGAIFYTPGQVELQPGLVLDVDHACMALLSTVNGTISLTLSNPENKPIKVTVHLSRSGKTTPVEIQLPDGGRAGASVTQQLAQ